MVPTGQRGIVVLSELSGIIHVDGKPIWKLATGVLISGQIAE